MKQNKTIGILVVVLLVLVGGIVLRNYLPTSSDADMYQELVGEVIADEVTEITLATASAELALVKNPPIWQMEGLRADFAEVEGLVQGLLEPEEVRLTSENENMHETLGVSETEATKAMLRAGDDNSAWLLGATDDGGHYVRKDGDVRVFWVSGLPASGNLTDVQAWVDLTVVRIPENAISQLAVNHSQEIVLLQTENGWVRQGEEEVVLDSNGFRSMLNSLVSLTAESLAVDAQLPEPYMTVVITQQQSEPVELSFYRVDDEVVWITSSETEGVFQIPASMADDFELTEVDLIPKVE